MSIVPEYNQNEFTMYPILEREVLAPSTYLYILKATDLSRACQPGQFVIVRLRKGGERIPLTIADFDRERGTITLVVKVIGKTTAEMATFERGSFLLDCVGPLGQPTEVLPLNHVVLVGGGLGVAPLFPILRGFHEAGSYLTTILGFRSKKDAFWEGKFTRFSDRLLLMTEDGSSGEKGTTVDGLRDLVDKSPIDRVITIGPLAMMQAIAEVTRPWKITTIASINPIMVDGIGMCGSCRVRMGEQVLFACVDGPDMDAHQVDFEELKIRQCRFQVEEREAYRRYQEDCGLRQKGMLSS